MMPKCMVKNCENHSVRVWGKDLFVCVEHHENMVSQPKANLRDTILEKRKVAQAIASTTKRGLPHGYQHCG